MEGSKLVPIVQELAVAPLSGEFLEKKVVATHYLYNSLIFLS